MPKIKGIGRLMAGICCALIHQGVGAGAFFLCQQLGQRLFRTYMPALKTLQLLLRLDARGDGEKAVETSTVVAAVLVLGAVIHRSAKLQLIV